MEKTIHHFLLEIYWNIHVSGTFIWVYLTLYTFLQAEKSKSKLENKNIHIFQIELQRSG